MMKKTNCATIAKINIFQVDKLCYSACTAVFIMDGVVQSSRLHLHFTKLAATFEYIELFFYETLTYLHSVVLLSLVMTSYPT